jgi:hypothetical protein
MFDLSLNELAVYGRLIVTGMISLAKLKNHEIIFSILCCEYRINGEKLNRSLFNNARLTGTLLRDCFTG